MKKLYEENDIRAIASAIKDKTGSSLPMKVSDMAPAIEGIDAGVGLGTFLTNRLTEVDLSGITLPQNVPVGLFSGLTNLEKIVLPAGMTAMSAYEFYRTTSLKTMYAINETEENNVVKIPEGVTSISSYCFYYGGNAASKLILPSTLTTLGSYWAEYSYFGEIDFSKATQITTLGAYGVAYSKVRVLDVRPTQITTLGTYGIRGNTALTSVYLPDTVSSIVDCCFYGCSNLTLVDFGNTRTTIPTLAAARAFYCTSTQAAYKDRKIVIPDALFDQWIASDIWNSTSYNLQKQYIKYSDYYK